MIICLLNNVNLNRKDVGAGIESRVSREYGLAVRCYECSEPLCSTEGKEFLDSQNNSFWRRAVPCTVTHLVRM